MLVEDSESYTALVQEWLKAEGDSGEFVLERVNDLASAQRRLREGDIDVVLYDLSLPDAFGMQGLAKLRSASNGASVIVLTNDANVHHAMDAVRGGAQDYLTKGTGSDPGIAAAIRAVPASNGDDSERLARVEASTELLTKLTLGHLGITGTLVIAILVALFKPSETQHAIIELGHIFGM